MRVSKKQESPVILSKAKNLILLNTKTIEILHPDTSGFRMTKDLLFLHPHLFHTLY